MQVNMTNEAEPIVTGRIRTKDGQEIDVQVHVPSDGSLVEEEVRDAALMMLGQQYPGCRWAWRVS